MTAGRLLGLAVIGVVAAVAVPTAAAFGFVIGEVAGPDGAAAAVTGLQADTGGEFSRSLLFSLWVASASVIVAAGAALVTAEVVADRLALGGGPEPATGAAAAIVAVPHVAWAAVVGGWLAQRGLLARLSAAVGVIDEPAQFPVLVSDRWGIGLIVHYATKEYPFLLVVCLAVLAGRPAGERVVAATLGLGPVARTTRLTWPLVRPALVGGGLIGFAFALQSVEAPLMLGSVSPRMLAVLAAEAFVDPTPTRRATAAVLGLVVALVAGAAAALGARGLRRSRT